MSKIIKLIIFVRCKLGNFVMFTQFTSDKNNKVDSLFKVKFRIGMYGSVAN